jgi:hypothetical protein
MAADKSIYSVKFKSECLKFVEDLFAKIGGTDEANVHLKDIEVGVMSPILASISFSLSLSLSYTHIHTFKALILIIIIFHVDVGLLLDFVSIKERACQCQKSIARSHETGSTITPTRQDISSNYVQAVITS